MGRWLDDNPDLIKTSFVEFHNAFQERASNYIAMDPDWDEPFPPFTRIISSTSVLKPLAFFVGCNMAFISNSKPTRASKVRRLLDENPALIGPSFVQDHAEFQDRAFNYMAIDPGWLSYIQGHAARLDDFYEAFWPHNQRLPYIL